MRRTIAFFFLALAPCAAGTIGLQNARLRAEIDEASGALAALSDGDGSPLLGPSSDRYGFQQDAKTEIISTESDDRVVSRAGTTFICQNDRLPGIRIEKAYVLGPSWLGKTVSFSTDAPDAGLLKFGSGSTASPEFYRDAYLNNPSRHPFDYPYLFAAELKDERRISDSHNVADHYLVICTNPKRGGGLAQYRFKVNGRFVHPLSSYAYEPSLYYGPGGWRMGCAAAWLGRDKPPLSCEVRWHVFSGDHVAFHREFMQLPDFEKEWSAPVPEWLGHVRATANWSWTSDSLRLDRYKKIADALPDDAVLLVMIGDVFCNTRSYLADPIPAPSGIPLPAAQLRGIVDGLHAISPKLRVGPVTWQWGFGDLDPVFREHPEWTVHDGEGRPVFAASGWSNEKVYSQLMTPECRDFVLGQYRGMVKRFDFDFIYMDTGQGGVTRFDWRTRCNAQDYDWADLYNGIRNAARSNREGITFFNGTPRLYSIGADCGYFEGVGIFAERDWRALADRLFLVKLYQGGGWTMPLYWTDKRKEEYGSYCLLLGLKPGAFMSAPDIARWPIIAAANELCTARLCPEANPSPCWWREKTETECYAMRVPNGALLTSLHHGTAPTNTTLSCDLAPLGLDAQKPLHLWQFTQKTVEEIDRTTLVTEAEANAIFTAEAMAPHRGVTARFLGTRSPEGSRFSLQVQLRPATTEIILLTHSAALTQAIAGRPTHLLLPAQPNSNVTMIPSDRPLAPELVAQRDDSAMAGKPRSALMMREQSSPRSANRSECPIGREVLGVRVKRFIAMDCEHNSEDAAGFNADDLHLWADMGQEKMTGFASAAVEAENLGTITLKLNLRPPIYGKYAVNGPSCFAGLTADYHTADGYSRRVLFPLAPTGQSIHLLSRPWWGVFEAKKKTPALVAPLEMRDEMILDLGRFAPDRWDGNAILGVHLESCGLGTRLDARLVANAPAGPRDPHAFRSMSAPRPSGKAGSFRGAALDRLEDGAILKDDTILMPSNGALEGTSLRVLTWLVKMRPDANGTGLWLNFHRTNDTYQLVKLPFGTGPLADKARPGSDSRFDIDLGQFAPKDWDGRVRIRLVGEGVSAQIIDNASFQIF